MHMPDMSHVYAKEKLKTHQSLHSSLMRLAYFKKVAQLSQRVRAEGWVTFG